MTGDRTARPLVGQISPAPMLGGVGEMLAHARFEVIPLKGVEEEVDLLPPGSTVTITCSPRKGVDATLDLAERLSAHGYRVIPHLSARLVTGPVHLAAVAYRVAAAGIDEVFVIGGDSKEPAGPYRSALGLLSAWADLPHGLPKVGVGAYPERHPLVDEAVLFDALEAKQRFASSMVTQICFDPDAFVAWLAGARARGITLPVHIGLPGALRRRKLLEMSLRVGVGDSIRFVTKHGNIVNRLVRRGGYRPDAFVAGIAPHAGDLDLGIAGLHLNTFNQIEPTERWRHRMIGVYGRRAWHQPPWPRVIGHGAADGPGVGERGHAR